MDVDKWGLTKQSMGGGWLLLLWGGCVCIRTQHAGVATAGGGGKGGELASDGVRREESRAPFSSSIVAVDCRGVSCAFAPTDKGLRRKCCFQRRPHTRLVCGPLWVQCPLKAPTALGGSHSGDTVAVPPGECANVGATPPAAVAWGQVNQQAVWEGERGRAILSASINALPSLLLCTPPG